MNLIRKGISKLAPAEIALLVALAVCGAEDAHSVSFTRIVSEDEILPGTGGQTFLRFSTPVVSDGRIGFHADSSGGGRGIYLSNGGPLTTIADKGTRVPGTTASRFRSLRTPRLGRTHGVFMGDAPPSPSAFALYTFEFGNPELIPVPIEGMPIPGGTGVFSALSSELSYDIWENKVLFVGLGENDQRGLYTYDLDSREFQPIADRNTTMPDDPIGRTFFGFLDPFIEGNRVAFSGVNIPARGIYFFDGLLKRVADTNTVRPNSSTQSTFRSFGDLSVDLDRVVFGAQKSIYEWEEGLLTTVLDDQDEVPGLDATFNVPSPIVDGDLVVFSDKVRGPDGLVSGIYAEKEGAIAKVVSEGDMLDGKEIVSIDAKVHSYGNNILGMLVEFTDDSTSIYRVDITGLLFGPPRPTDTPTAGPSPTPSPDATSTTSPTPTSSRTSTPSPTPAPATFPDLSLSKWVPPSNRNPLVPEDLMVGDFARFSIVVLNEGDATTTGPITVVDALPQSLRFSHFVGDGWDCSVEGQTVTCVREAPLSPDSTSEFFIVAVVLPEAVPSFQNSAIVDTEGDRDEGNNDTTVDVSVAKSQFLIEILIPKEGDSILSGKKPQVVFRANAPNGTGSGAVTWDGGGEYFGRKLTIRESPNPEVVLQTPAVPSSLSDGDTVVFSAQAFHELEDGRIQGSDIETVTTRVKKEPGTPVVRFIDPSPNRVFSGNEVDGLHFLAVARIETDLGLLPKLFDLPKLEGVAEPALVNVSRISYTVRRNDTGLSTEMFLFISVDVKGENFEEVFLLDSNAVNLRVEVTDAEFNKVGQSLPLVILDDTPPKSESLSSGLIGKGNNQVDSRSRILNSLVTNSSVNRSLIIDSTVDNSQIDSSVLLPGVVATNAEIDFGVVLSGTVSRDGVPLVPPAQLADLYGAGEYGHVLSTVLTGDADEDGSMTAVDWLALPPVWRKASEAFDLNLNEDVDAEDLLTILHHWRIISSISQ